MNSTTHTCSGLHPDILETTENGDLSPIIATKGELGEDRGMVTCWFAFPGCDFEIYIHNEIACAFRRGDTVRLADDEASVPMGWIDFKVQRLSRKEFNRELHNNMVTALRRVTDNGDIVGTSRHFVDVFASLIDDLDTACEEFAMSDALRDRLNDVKVKAFTTLLSEDLRRG